MSSDCEKIKDQIADLVTGILSDAQVHLLEQHLNQCAACRDYACALKDEDMFLTELFAKIDTDMTSRQERVLQAINQSGVSRQSETHLIRRTIMKSPITKLAAAAVIIIAAIISVIQFGGSVTNVAWAEVVERFESVPFFSVTLYAGNDTSTQAQKIEIWKSENSQVRAHEGNNVIFADFADGNNVVAAFDRSTMQPVNADGIAATALFLSVLCPEPVGRFSLKNILSSLSSEDDIDVSAVETSDNEALRETVVFEAKHKTRPKQRVTIWALRESRLPIRMRFRSRSNYCDFLFDYSEKKDSAFFDSDAFTSK